MVLSDEALRLEEADLRGALMQMSPSAGAGVALSNARPGGDGHRPNAGVGAGSKGGWASVGGLEQVKQVLYEAVLLPRAHPKLFASAPLRLTSGVLLYGPTGCGKTLVARSLAEESGLPLIAVKGPELLNKYIGASEAAVCVDAHDVVKFLMQQGAESLRI